MAVYVLHNHLKVGGVTTIIGSQAEAHPGLTILTGDNPDNRAFKNATVIVEPSLNYLNENLPPEQLKAQFNHVNDWLRSTVQIKDILHVHNLTLGKNPLLTRAVLIMAREGYRVVNHCHDFAEDRPDRMAFFQKVYNAFNENAASELYPNIPKLLYAVLNTTDEKRLLDAGIAPDRLHLLPNPVTLPQKASREQTAEARQELCSTLQLLPDLPIMVYPVRAIKRKNLAELLLLAAAFKDRANWLVTRAPSNPAEVPLYEAFKQLAQEAGIAVTFEAGHKLPFATIMHGCDRIITTSIMEGFGMVFLEPWGYGKPVCGRDLPMVTDDFKNNGIKLTGLYSQLCITGHEDFPTLPLEEQHQLILEAGSGNISIPQEVEKMLFCDTIPSDIDTNRQLIEQKYSLDAYGKHLTDIYSKLTAID